ARGILFLSYSFVMVPRTAMLVKSSINSRMPTSQESTSVRRCVVANFISLSATAPVAPVEDQMPRMQPNSATNRAYHTVSSLQPTEYIKSINPVRKPVLYCRMQHKSAPATSEEVVLLVLMAM